jgi:hypothetical protein
MTSAEYQAQYGRGKRTSLPTPVAQVELKPPPPKQSASVVAANTRQKPKQQYPDANTPRIWGGESSQFGRWLKYTGLSETQFDHLRAYAQHYLNTP